MKHLRWSFFVKIVNGFKLLIIFTKKLHLRCLTRSWIRLYRSSHLRGVLENRCSEICSQNPWKIPMKNFIFSKVAGWQSATFSHVPWGFYVIKKFVKIVFFASFFLRQKVPGTRLCNFNKNELLQRYFSRILTENLPWQLSEQLFIRTSFFPEYLCSCFQTLFSSTRLLFILCF